MKLVPLFLLLALCVLCGFLTGCQSGLPRLTKAETARARALHPAGARLSSAFVVLSKRTVGLSAGQWRVTLDQARALGIRHVILADRVPDSEAAIGIILEYADAHGLEVLLTVPHNRQWYPLLRRDPLELAAETARAMERRWARFGRHRCVVGWYDYPEFGRLGPLVPRVRAYYRAVSAAIARISPGRAHAISPYAPDGYPVSLWGREWQQVLTGSGVTQVWFQDGVGVHGGCDPLTRLPYWRSLSRACRAAGVEMCGNVESFVHLTKDPVTYRVSTSAELRAQLAVAGAFARRITTWELAYVVEVLR